MKIKNIGLVQNFTRNLLNGENMKIKNIGLVLVATLFVGQAVAKDLATVNGVAITQSEVDRLIILSKQGGRKDMTKAEALEALIQTEAMFQKAKELKIDRRPEIKKQLAEFLKQLVISKMIEEIADKIVISDEEYNKAYAEMKKTLDGKQYNAKHILLKDEKVAKEVISKLDAGGDFTKLAAEYSIGPTSSTGGELNWFSPNAMDQDFIKGLQKLEKGKYTKQPVKSQFGFHVIFLNDEKDVKPPSLESVKLQLKNMLLSAKLIAHVNELVAKAKVGEDKAD